MKQIQMGMDSLSICGANRLHRTTLFRISVHQ